MVLLVLTTLFVLLALVPISSIARKAFVVSLITVLLAMILSVVAFFAGLLAFVVLGMIFVG